MAKKSKELTLVTPSLKSFDCEDLDPIEAWVPSGDSVWYQLTLSIGPPDSEGADLFRVDVATPTGLREARQRGERIGLPPPIVVNPYGWSEVMVEIERRLEACRDLSWFGMQESLRKQFLCEYEGM